MPRIFRHYTAGDAHSARQRSRATESLTLWWCTDTHLWHLAGTDPSRDGPPQFIYSTIPGKLANLISDMNKQSPKYFIHTGDGIERGDGVYDPSDDPDYEYGAFRSLFWDQIPAGTQKMYAPGNHDYSLIPDDGKTLNDTIARCMGYDADSGGSKNADGWFNQSYVLTENGVSVKMIVIDNMQERDGSDPNMTGRVIDHGSLSDAQKTWITDELANSVQDIIMLACHVGAHDVRRVGDAWDEPGDRTDLLNIVAAEQLARPNRQISHLFGHRHVTTLTRYTNVPGFPGWLSPCFIQGNPAAYTKISIFADGHMIFNTAPVYGGFTG